MRPYQVYATRRVLEKWLNMTLNMMMADLGMYGTQRDRARQSQSFKTAWLASRLPHVHKVVFLVDRIALTRQTVDAYQAYDPLSRGKGNQGLSMIQLMSLI